MLWRDNSGVLIIYPRVTFEDPSLVELGFIAIFCLRIQQIAIANSELTYTHKCNLHAIAIALLALLARVTGVNNIMEYCEKIVESRKEDALFLLPGLIDPERNMVDSTSLNLPHLMIDKVLPHIFSISTTYSDHSQKLLFFCIKFDRNFFCDISSTAFLIPACISGMSSKCRYGK